MLLVDDDDEEIYIPSKHLIRFARLYKSLGANAIAQFKEEPIHAMHQGLDGKTGMAEATISED